ncbi:Uncharacterised protein [uncultured archaeon]|nr:Uncharacterised protein [uncultured archaeon]
MKGFIFSIEAIAALMIVLTIMGTLYFSTGNYMQKTNTLELQAQSQEASALYFNLPGQAVISNTQQQYCSKITVYVPDTKALSDKILCRWIK